MNWIEKKNSTLPRDTQKNIWGLFKKNFGIGRKNKILTKYIFRPNNVNFSQRAVANSEKTAGTATNTWKERFLKVRDKEKLVIMRLERRLHKKKELIKKRKQNNSRALKCIYVVSMPGEDTARMETSAISGTTIGLRTLQRR